MKHRFALLLAGLLCALCVSPGIAQAQSAPTIGVSLASDVNPFYIAMKRGVDERAKELGVRVIYVTANEVVSAQVNGIQDLVAQKVDGILASPIDSVAVGAAYEAAGKAGIPVISIGRRASSAHQTAFVSMDEVGIGHDIASWIIDGIGGKGKIAMLTGPAGSATFRNITKGFDTAVAKAPQVQVAYRKEAPPTRESGLKLAEDALVAHPDLAAIYGANDELALGAAQAVASMGLKGKVLVTGMNGTPPAINAVKAGSLSMTVELNPVAWGRLALDTMVDYLKGEKPSDEVSIRHKLIDRNNVDEVLARMKN